MRKQLFTIIKNDKVADRTFRLEVQCKEGILPIRSGQFADIALDGFFLRRPLSVCDFSSDSITFLYKVVGAGTRHLSEMRSGEELDILSGLGNGFSPDSCRRKALLAGGGLGSAPLYLLCKELLSLGRSVSLVLGFNRQSEIVLKEEFRALGVEPLIATLDGGEGEKGFTTDVIAKLNESEFDYFYTCGPLVMMKAVCKALPSTNGEASLEERMGCGAGFCYGCSCHTRTQGTKRICKDGPVFKKEEIVW